MYNKYEKTILPINKTTIFKTTKNKFVVWQEIGHVVPAGDGVAKKNVGKITNFYLNFFILLSIDPNNSNTDSFFKLLTDYFTIWPVFQWITSLLTLVLTYWASGYLYNRFLSEKGGWMDAKTRVIMIVVDLILNFSLGIYYMQYRDTFMGALMVHCPVFFSPVFWLIELICFYIYTRFFLKNQAKAKKEI